MLNSDDNDVAILALFGKYCIALTVRSSQDAHSSSSSTRPALLLLLLQLLLLLL
jgi:hypothetical protein